MAQDKIKINGITIRQPDEGLGYDFETTYDESAQRAQNGKLKASRLFTVEALSYTASNLTLDEMKTILQQVAKGSSFTLHYFSPYYGAWRDGKFYVGRGNLSIGRLIEGGEVYESLSIQMTGVNPI